MKNSINYSVYTSLINWHNFVNKTIWCHLCICVHVYVYVWLEYCLSLPFFCLSFSLHLHICEYAHVSIYLPIVTYITMWGMHVFCNFKKKYMNICFYSCSLVHNSEFYVKSPLFSPHFLLQTILNCFDKCHLGRCTNTSAIFIHGIF
jgi:hypothetical protein